MNIKRPRGGHEITIGFLAIDKNDNGILNTIIARARTEHENYDIYVEGIPTHINKNPTYYETIVTEEGIKPIIKGCRNYENPIIPCEIQIEFAKDDNICYRHKSYMLSVVLGDKIARKGKGLEINDNYDLIVATGTFDPPYGDNKKDILKGSQIGKVYRVDKIKEKIEKFKITIDPLIKDGSIKKILLVLPKDNNKKKEIASEVKELEDTYKDIVEIRFADHIIDLTDLWENIYIEIEPKEVKLNPGQKWQFKAQACYQENEKMSIDGFTWDTSSGGNITKNDGIYTVNTDNQGGEFEVVAEARGIEGKAKVIVPSPNLTIIKVEPCKKN